MSLIIKIKIIIIIITVVSEQLFQVSVIKLESVASR